MSIWFARARNLVSKPCLLYKLHSNLNTIVPIPGLNLPLRYFSHTTANYWKSEEERAALDLIVIERHPERDRRYLVDIDTSIRYLKSTAFKEAYGDHPVWFHYRRNYKGHRLPKKTRTTCVRGDIVATGSPCPICRDEYLIVDYKNIDLLKQFISPVSGNLYPTEKTGVCQKQHKNLQVAYRKALDLGLISYDVPFRKYDYSEYQPK